MKTKDILLGLIIACYALIFLVCSFIADTNKKLEAISTQLTEYIEIDNQRYEELCSRIEVLEEAIK